MENRASLKICALGSLYNGERPNYLYDCLNSLRNQTLKIPIILVIDGPISKSLEEVLASFKDLKIRLIRNKINRGLSYSLQSALNLISNEFEYAIRFDSDDINSKKRFEVLAEFLKGSNVDLLSSHMHEIDEAGKIFSKRVVPISHKSIKKRIPYRNPINHPASAFKISSVKSVKGYQEMPFFEDWYLWIRMINAGFKAANIDDYLVFFRATDEMLYRRYGFPYLKNEAYFFKRRAKEKLINPFENWLAFFLRVLPKPLGFNFFKKIYFFIRN